MDSAHRSDRSERSDLLASPGTADLSGRLRQASSRTAYLARANRALSGAMQPQRAMDLALDLVVGDLADWAQLAVRTGQDLECRALAADGDVEVATVPLPRDRGSLLTRVLGQGVGRLLQLADEPGRRSEEVDSAVPAEPLRRSLLALRPSSLLVVPLTARGRTFGTLTLGRRTGRGFDPEAVGFVESVAQSLAGSLDTTRILAESRRVGRVLARDLAPPRLPEASGVRFATYYRVAFDEEALGGDFYDVHGSDDDWTAVVGDVCGKGVEAAVLTGRVRQAVRTAALVDRSPSRILDLVNRVLVADGGDTFVTAVCARVRARGERLLLDVAAAGHPEPYLLRRDGGLEPLPAKGTVLGLFPDNDYRDMQVELRPGDAVLFYTDGVVEAPGFSERYGEERLHRLLQRTPREDVTAVVEMVAVSLSDHLGDRPHDDIAVLGVQNVNGGSDGA